ncbi:hypothetical protein KEJ49_03605 [Candidatus Bathyarchaeota archaeon]|nr:hypothetical protein [Candidatus Bathyarchaeota archaeon]
MERNSDVLAIVLKVFEEVARDLAEAIQSKAKAEDASPSEEQLATKKQREASHKFGIKQIPRKPFA